MLASQIADAMGYLVDGELPKVIQLPENPAHPGQYRVEYSIDQSLQEKMELLFKRYRPDYGSFVAIDPQSGRILSMVSYSSADEIKHLSVKATFPSASVFKVVTAAAAIELKHFKHSSLFAMNGRNHTLYKSQVFRTRFSKWTRVMTLGDAFALSVNSIFGKLGVFHIGAEALMSFATRFGFNRDIGTDLRVEKSVSEVPMNDWELAEVSSGFTLSNRMSPLLGASIAATIANDGRMMKPYVVSRLSDSEGEVIYEGTPRFDGQVVSGKTAFELKRMMQATIQRGTSKKSFRGFSLDENGITVGGKTGSLTGDAPEGKYDWFVGFAEAAGRRVAVSALTINKQYWKVKSSYLARKAFEYQFASRFGTDL